MHRPKRIVTTDEKIYDAILAELVDLNVSTAATHAHNVVTRLKEHDEPKKTSDITGFPEDDDIESEEIDRQAEYFSEAVQVGEREWTENGWQCHESKTVTRRRIPGMPRQL